jgi:hypothetical protein
MLQSTLLATVSTYPLHFVDIEEKSEVTISLHMHAMSLQALGGHLEGISGTAPFRYMYSFSAEVDTATSTET